MLFLFTILPIITALILLGAFRAARSENIENGSAPGLPYWIGLSGIALTFLLAIYLFFRQAADFRLPIVLSMGLHFTLDGFRRVYSVIIGFMWLLTMLLSKEYFRGHRHNVRFYFFSLLTEGAILGVFLAADLFTALVFFEIMSFTSFVWVIQEETEGAVRAANTYLAIAVIGGLSALMGIFLLQHGFGTTEIAALYEAAESCDRKGLLYAAGICILVGFGAKAGMFPLHIWLPKAHPVAPAPASALLSGLLTKSGLFGVIAISCGLFREDPRWGAAILALGVITMLLGAVLALLSVDLKRTLACSSMSQIGFILIGIACTCLLGEEGNLPAAGAVLHMVNHSLLKLVLFMCAGVVHMNLHALDLNQIRGFGRGKTVLQICFLLGALGIGGIPGFNGYISKTLLHEGIVEAAHLYGPVMRVVEWIFLISGGLTLSYMTKLYICIFHEKADPDAAALQKKAEAKRPSYLGAFGHSALLLSAVLMPLLGLTGNTLMRGISGLSADFFRAENIPKMAFFSWENLKGAGISLLIAAAVYLLVVRKLLMKDGRYVNRLPKKLDLEELIYRPLLLRVLPGIFGPIAALFGENKLLRPAARLVMKASAALAALFGENKVLSPLSRAVLSLSGLISRAQSDMVDAAVYGLRRTVFRPVLPPSTDHVENSVSYRLGNSIDRVMKRRGREEKGAHRFAQLFYRIATTFIRTTHYLSDSMSFALFMLILALSAILFYILFVHHFN